MNLVRQPKGSNQCGQACIATICNVSLEAAIKMTGAKGRTTTRQLIQAITKAGMYCPPKLKRGKPTGLAIVKFLHPDGRSHWVVWDKKYYDPSAGVFKKVPKYLEGSRQTSYLRVK